MTLSIKNPEAHRLAKEVARLTGVSMTEAVIAALQERLERIRRREQEIHDLREIAHDISSHLEEPFKSIDHADLLYDERGLPKGSW